MDPSYASSEDEAEAMAKAMGFSSFGTQGPTKKRKFNPKTDAMIEGQELAALDRGGTKGQGSGGNKIPLGKARVFGVAPKSNQEEIDLDVDDENEEELAHIDTFVPLPPNENDSQEDEGPAYIDTSLPPPIEDTRIAQQRIDATNSFAATVPPDLKTEANPMAIESGGGAGRLINLSQHKSRLSIPNIVPVIGRGLPDVAHHHLRQQGQKNDLWYIGYYDPSFNENPWAKLEKANGLEPVGTWIERGERAT